MVKRQKGMYILGGFISSVIDVLGKIFDTIPAPIKLMFFVFFITVLANFIIPNMLAAGGYVCVEDAGIPTLYKIPIQAVPSNTIDNLGQELQRIINPLNYDLPDDPHPDGDRTRLRIRDECFVQSTFNGSEVIGYTGRCTTCPKNINLFSALFNEPICIDDGFRTNSVFTIPASETAQYCTVCAPPYPYYYNHTECITGSECYFTILDESLVDLVDNPESYRQRLYYERIAKNGGVKSVQSESSFVNVQCNQDFNPQLQFFSIQVFNRTMWIYLIIAYGFISLAMMYYSVML